MASTSSTSNPPSSGQSDTIGSKPDQASIDSKIIADLDVVNDKMDTCETLLRSYRTRTGAAAMEAATPLLATIGFLEASSPRMVELIEAAALGALSEHVLMRLLEVNDRLTKVLADIDAVPSLPNPPTTPIVAARSDSKAEGLDDVLLEESIVFESDDDRKLPAQPQPKSAPLAPVEHPLSEDTKPPATAAASSNDGDFDAFFDEDT